MQVVEIDVGVKCRAGERREHKHGGVHFRVSHQRQVNETFDRLFFQVSPDYLVLGLDFFASGMSRHFDAEEVQALESDVNTLRYFRFYEMQMNLEAVGGRLVDFRRASRQQLRDESFGLVEVPVQVFALRTFKTQGECELVLIRIVQA